MGNILSRGVELETNMGNFGTCLFSAESSFWCSVGDFEEGYPRCVWGGKLVDDWGNDPSWDYWELCVIR
jgi:hypothetical protein